MLHMFAGLVMMALGIWGIVAWWDVFGLVMRGVVPFALLVVGLVALMAGFRRGATSQQQSFPARAEPQSTESTRSTHHESAA